MLADDHRPRSADLRALADAQDRRHTVERICRLIVDNPGYYGRAIGFAHSNSISSMAGGEMFMNRLESLVRDMLPDLAERVRAQVVADEEEARRAVLSRAEPA